MAGAVSAVTTGGAGCVTGAVAVSSLTGGSLGVPASATPPLVSVEDVALGVTVESVVAVVVAVESLPEALPTAAVLSFPG